MNNENKVINICTRFKEPVSKEFIKIDGIFYDIDENVSIEVAAKFLHKSKSTLYKKTCSTYSGRDKLPFIKTGEARKSSLEFKIRDLVEYKEKASIYKREIIL